MNTGQVTAIYSMTATGLSANKIDAIKYAYLNLREYHYPWRSVLYTLSFHFCDYQESDTWHLQCCGIEVVRGGHEGFGYGVDWLCGEFCGANF